jgi:antitoxin ParD1/3/4
MGRNTSVSLGDYFENFVDNSVSEGRFKMRSEVIRAGLRLEEENKIIALKMPSRRNRQWHCKETLILKHLESKSKKNNV